MNKAGVSSPRSMETLHGWFWVGRYACPVGRARTGFEGKAMSGWNCLKLEGENGNCSPHGGKCCFAAFMKHMVLFSLTRYQVFPNKVTTVLLTGENEHNPSWFPLPIGSLLLDTCTAIAQWADSKDCGRGYHLADLYSFSMTLPQMWPDPPEYQKDLLFSQPTGWALNFILQGCCQK